MIFITRRERFSAAHRMFSPELSDSENLEIYGKCSNPNWHGHNYILYVTIKGEVDPRIGFLMNITKLKSIIKDHVIDIIDHKNINIDVDFMSGKIATTENIAIAIWEKLEPVISKENVILHCVRLEETENNFIEYYGKD